MSAISLPCLPLKSGVSSPSCWISWFGQIECGRPKLCTFQGQALRDLQLLLSLLWDVASQSPASMLCKPSSTQRTVEALWLIAMAESSDNSEPHLEATWVRPIWIFQLSWSPSQYHAEHRWAVLVVLCPNCRIVNKLIMIFVVSHKLVGLLMNRFNR